MAKAKKGAKGGGTIRKKTVTRGGKEYTYWEARITTGRNPGTGRQIQRSFTGKTQKEVRERLQAAAVAVNDGTYIEPSRLTVGQWLDIWARDYLGGDKPRTVSIYSSNIKNHIKPAMGAVKLAELHPHMVQRFINGITDLSSASIRLIYKILHMALEKAVDLDYIPKNPAARCVLPKAEQEEVRPLTDEQAAALLNAAKGGELENLVAVALFTGCRLSELLGLTWDAIDFENGTISIDKQLTPTKMRKDHGLFSTPKNGKPRTITAAPAVFSCLRQQKRRLMELQLKAGPLWDNTYNLVFTLEDGGPFNQQSVDHRFKRLLAAAGLEDIRFHDLRHTYAVNAIRAGDDIKTVQGNLGHASAAFTLDKYGHFTEQMKKASAARMDSFIKDVLNL